LRDTEIDAHQTCAPQAQVEMLGTLLDTLSISSVDLIASDSGGLIAQLFMLAYPDRVRTLLLTNCDVEPYTPPPAFLPILKLARAGQFADRLVVPWLADKELARSARGLGSTFTFPEKLSDEAIDYYLAPLVSSPERKAHLHAFALALDPNPLAGIEPALRKCETRTRIVWGTGDDVFSQASPDYLDQILPKSQGVRRVSGAKLFFPEEYPELIAEELRALWSVG
jgi:pimeloyl-ACP methyl ester carboxylesterase